MFATYIGHLSMNLFLFKQVSSFIQLLFCWTIFTAMGTCRKLDFQIFTQAQMLGSLLLGYCSRQPRGRAFQGYHSLPPPLATKWMHMHAWCFLLSRWGEGKTPPPPPPPPLSLFLLWALPSPFVPVLVSGPSLCCSSCCFETGKRKRNPEKDDSMGRRWEGGEQVILRLLIHLVASEKSHRNLDLDTHLTHGGHKELRSSMIQV